MSEDKDSKEPATVEVDPSAPLGPGLSRQIVTKRQTNTYLLSFMVTSLVLFSTYSALGSIVLPIQVQGIVPPTGPGGEKATMAALAQVLAVSSIFTIFAQPLVGALSDRTRTRWGRRTPWILAGGTLGMLGMLGLYVSNTILLVTVFWVLTQVFLNFLQAPLSTTVADRIPEESRGKISGFSGAATMLGSVLGGFFVGQIVGTLGLTVYLIFAVLVVASAIFFIATAKDTSSRELPVTKFSIIQFFKGFWINPIKYPDFGWAFAARFLLILGYWAVSAFNVYLLQFYIQPALSESEAGAMAGTIMIAGAPGMIIGSLVGGYLSDKTGKRKVFVVGASIVMAAALVLPMVSPTVPAMLIQAVITGFAFGTYMAVDVALIIDVLPNPEDAGKDLGVANIATNVPQALGPVIATQVVAITGSYQFLFGWAIFWILLAAVAVIPIKKVR